MNTLTNIILKFKQGLLFCLPLVYIFYILYLRLILVRPQRPLFVPLSWVQIVLTITIMLVLLMNIYLLLKKLDIIKEKENKSILVIWCLKKIAWLTELFTAIWRNFYRYFIVKSKYAVKIHLRVNSFGIFLDKHDTVRFMFTTILVLQVFPKIILLTAFLIDIFLYKQFFYFYKALGLLLLPLIYNTLRAILAQFAADNYNYLQECVTMTFHNVEGTDFFRVKYAFAEGYKPAYFVKDLDDFLENHLFPIIGINKIIHLYDVSMDYLKIPWVFLVINLLYLMGWATVLIFGI